MFEARDIVFENDNDFYEALGYIARKIRRLDSEIPEGMDNGRNGYLIKEKGTPSGWPTKVGVHNRIYLRNADNRPDTLEGEINWRKGNGYSIDRSAFVRKLVSNHGFDVGKVQNIRKIRSMVPSRYLADFDRGYRL